MATFCPFLQGPCDCPSVKQECLQNQKEWVRDIVEPAVEHWNPDEESLVQDICDECKAVLRQDGTCPVCG